MSVRTSGLALRYRREALEVSPAYLAQWGNLRVEDVIEAEASTAAPDVIDRVDAALTLLEERGQT